MTRTVLLAIIFTFATISSAGSHSFYAAGCCSGRDCAPIPEERVTLAEDGYHVTLLPGDLPGLTAKISAIFRDVHDTRPGKKARYSGDDQYHACVNPARIFTCVYVPEPRL